MPAQRVLLVDDAAPDRELARRMLAALAYPVAEAADAMEAIVLFDAAPEGQRFAVLLTDMRMPRIDGVMLARTLLRRDPALKIVITSGFLTVPADVLAELSALVIPKPFRKAELLAVLRQALGDTDS